MQASPRAFLARTAALALSVKVVRGVSAPTGTPSRGRFRRRSSSPGLRRSADELIHTLLEREVNASFVGKLNLKDDLLRYPAACAGPINACCHG